MHDGFDRGPYTDPFDVFGLDSDPPPKKVDPDDHYAKREVPHGAWDGFAPNRLDRNNIGEQHIASYRGRNRWGVPSLPQRLSQLGVWLRTVADQPAAIWWAMHQPNLDPDIQDQVRYELERSDRDSSSEARRAWRYLFESWRAPQDGFPHDWYQLKHQIAKDGWDSATARAFADCQRPHLKVSKPFGRGPVPPERSTKLNFERLLRLEVTYSHKSDKIEVPTKWLSFVIARMRENLQTAGILEAEAGGFHLGRISPINRDPSPDIDGYERSHGLSGAVIDFSSYFERLATDDPEAARRELNAWPLDEERVFERLRIWAAGLEGLTADDDVGKVFRDLSSESFWSMDHQRDLLLSLHNRWYGITEAVRAEIESKILEGPARWANEEDENYIPRRAWSILNRVSWLQNQGIKFSNDIEPLSQRLREEAPEWKSEYSDGAASSFEGRGGMVKTKTEYSLLINEPVSSTLARALELSGRSDDFLVENDPFSGLSAERPVHAFGALTHAAKQGEFPEWAWRTFLNCSG